MLTKTLRQMEADGLVLRTVFPVVPQRIEYELTPLGQSLGTAFAVYGPGPKNTARSSWVRALRLMNGKICLMLWIK